MNNNRRRNKLLKLQTKLKYIQKQINKLISECPHHVVKRRYAAVCDICGKTFGWYCSKSPDHICYYTHEADSNRTLTLLTGEKYTIPTYLDLDFNGEDICIFCEQPSERK